MKNMQEFLGKEYKISLYYRKDEGKIKNERESKRVYCKKFKMDYKSS